MASLAVDPGRVFLDKTNLSNDNLFHVFLESVTFLECLTVKICLLIHYLLHLKHSLGSMSGRYIQASM